MDAMAFHASLSLTYLLVLLTTYLCRPGHAAVCGLRRFGNHRRRDVELVLAGTKRRVRGSTPYRKHYACMDSSGWRRAVPALPMDRPTERGRQGLGPRPQGFPLARDSLASPGSGSA